MSWRATTMPSPPLFPFPHRMATVSSSRFSNRSSRTSTTRMPAFSIRMRLGIPCFSDERRSTSRTCSGVRIFIRRREHNRHKSTRFFMLSFRLMQLTQVKELETNYLLGAYSRYELLADRGSGAYLIDKKNKRYLDL